MDTAATFVFVDIAGFTALTEAHGDREAADLVEDFCRGVREALPDYGGGDVVKTIGDALMLRLPEAGPAVLLALYITNELMRAHGYPEVRAGLHRGPAIEREGDWYGAAVNLAARVSATATGGEVLLTAPTAEAAGELPGVALEPRGTHHLRHVREPIDLVAAVRQGERPPVGLELDPVCRMAVDPARAAGRLVHRGATYIFCSLECAGEFARRPDVYANAGAPPAPST